MILKYNRPFPHSTSVRSNHSTKTRLWWTFSYTFTVFLSTLTSTWRYCLLEYMRERSIKTKIGVDNPYDQMFEFICAVKIKRWQGVESDNLRPNLWRICKIQILHVRNNGNKINQYAVDILFKLWAREREENKDEQKQKEVNRRRKNKRMWRVINAVNFPI